MTKYWLFIICFFPAIAYSQVTTSKAKYSNITTIGTIWGANDNVIGFESINGVQLRKMYYGIGICVDGYGIRSTPIFLHMRKKINNSKLFVYMNTGFNIPWRTREFENITTSWYSSQFKMYLSPYAETGFGFEVPINKEVCFTTNFGYSYKTFKYDETTSGNWSNIPITTKYNYDYRRIALRMGIKF